MKYLLDTNIWLEQLLAQNNAKDVEVLLNTVASDQIAVSDFSFHSICVILSRLRATNILLQFVQDVFIDAEVTLLSLTPPDTLIVIQAMNTYSLDFDDAYQHTVATKYDLHIVSFDSHVDRTPRGRTTPRAISQTGTAPGN